MSSRRKSNDGGDDVIRSPSRSPDQDRTTSDRSRRSGRRNKGGDPASVSSDEGARRPAASSRRNRKNEADDGSGKVLKQSDHIAAGGEAADDATTGSGKRSSRRNKKTVKTKVSDPASFSSDGFDAAFGAFGDLPAFPSSSISKATATPSFDTAFTTEPNFDSTNFGTADFGTSNNAGFDAFDQTPAFPSQPVWDKSPLTDVPKMKPKMFTLQQKAVLTKNFQGSPVNNPANGNIIFASSSPKGVYLHEIDPNRGSTLQVAAVPILTADLQKKVATKYNATVTAVEKVWTLAAGLQNSSGQTRTRVAAIVDLYVLESSSRMRVVAVWHWNYGNEQLQYVMTPPAVGEFVCDLTSLQVADGLCFLAGSSPKGACVFISKPAVREAWSANFLTGSGTVAAMSVSPTHPYLVIALTDLSVTVWTYKSALVKSAAPNSGAKASKRFLFPLCRLDHAKQLAVAKRTNPDTDSKVSVGKDSDDVGNCTHLAWLPPQPTQSSLVLLAVAFKNGFAVFHVELPVVVDSSSKIGYHPLPEPTQTTIVSTTPLLSPIVAKRWKGNHESSFVSWLDFGPHVDPCLGFLLHDTINDVARVLLTALKFPSYESGPLVKERRSSCSILASATIAKDNVSFPGGLLQCCGTKSLVAFSASRISLFALSSSSSAILDSDVASLGQPVASYAPGLSSSGNPLLVDADSDKDGILHIFSSIVCKRQKVGTEPSLLQWSEPTRRFWLCESTVGDTNETFIEEEKEERGFGDNDEVAGGASSRVICDLCHDSLVGLVPFRIVRCQGRKVCSVLFRHSLGSESISQAVAIALIDYGSAKAVIEVIENRDIVFFSSEGDKSVRGLVLKNDGSALTYFTWNSAQKIELASSFRPIVGVDSDKDYVDCQRVMVFSEGTKLALAVVGKRQRDERICFVGGKLCESTDATEDGWSKLLPNIVSDRVAWLEESENVYSLLGLQGDGSGYRNFALATSSRVLIVSSALTICAQLKNEDSCGRLAPLGSFAVCFLSGNMVRYLCCLDVELSSGVIASVAQPKMGYAHDLLLAVRPDRFLLFRSQCGLYLIEFGRSPDTFLLPLPTIQPALFLEPMVANAVCVGGKGNQSTPVLRSVIEKFGRKVTSITHCEKEGIGQYGAGLTPKTFAMLSRYQLTEASSWLATGTVKFDRTANSKILPAWLPVGPKAKGVLNSDAFLHVVANGDSYFSEYVKSPEQNMASSLPRQSDPTCYLSREFAQNALSHGQSPDSLKILDIAGAVSTDSLMLQISLMLEKAKKSNNATGVLKSMSGFDDNGFSRLSVAGKAPSSLAALAVALKMNSRAGTQEMKEDQIDHWMKPLAPSLQRCKRPDRTRQRLLGEKDLESVGGKEADRNDGVWTTPCNETRHVWNEGPRKEKENLLLLDGIEEWLGRRRPLIIGKEGASAAKDRGEKTLADILNQDDDSFGGKDDMECVEENGWVDGIGEGRSDEANLSGYFRMSEGDEEDSDWRTEGLFDLSPYQNKAVLVGDTSSFSLQQSTSSVDEGEPGKVKSLFDLVFDQSVKGVASGLAVPATRGGSLDIGVLHKPDRQSRQKCSIEFWYYLPSSESMADEVILARRSFGSNADDLSKVCLASDKDSVLWELVLQNSGELEFRSCAGSAIISTQKNERNESDVGGVKSKKETERSDVAVFERWNHVCLVFSSKGLGITECDVSIYMKGVSVASAKVSLLPPGIDEQDLENDAKLDSIMQKSYVVFGLNHSAGFRMTELRFWACERSADDTQSFLYEYLTAAEQKKKFKVKIANKNKKGAGLGKGLGLAPPKGMLGPSKSGILASRKSTTSTVDMSLAPPTNAETTFSLAPPKQTAQTVQAPKHDPATTDESKRKLEAPRVGKVKQSQETTGFEAAFSSFDSGNDTSEMPGAPSGTSLSVEEDDHLLPNEEDEDQEENVAKTLWDTAIPLSQQIRPSAASAMVRGPPATRHYGGNRGGLPDFSGVERFGVGGIAICGSEKTIVFRDNEDPPALTYPIGASGAIVSDQMDDEGSEFLCCFLAKEGRMVVFELRSRTVVVELQMTTKLNFWRYLPPEAAENTLCFMLVTPVGGFHWMPLEESPRPHQVWKRGPELQGKKVVSYEEGGSNGLDGFKILSRVGLVLATRSSGGSSLEGWLVPISGDSQAQQISDDMLGACLCQPAFLDDGPFLPLLVTVHAMEGGVWVNIVAITEPEKGSLALGDVEATQLIDANEIDDVSYDPPALAMGSSPDALCVSLSNIIVVVLRRKGLVAAFELEEQELNLIAQESVGHYVIDAVMRYSAEVGGAEIVMLLSDDDNPKDGRIVSFCFRSAV